MAVQDEIDAVVGQQPARWMMIREVVERMVHQRYPQPIETVFTAAVPRLHLLFSEQNPPLICEHAVVSLLVGAAQPCRIEPQDVDGLSYVVEGARRQRSPVAKDVRTPIAGLVFPEVTEPSPKRGGALQKLLAPR